MDTLVFIDTNILLDFYRIRKSDVGDKYLSLVDKHSGKLISSYQIEMEYKKNRQAVIMEALSNLKAPEFAALSPPAMFSDSEQVRILENDKKDIRKRVNELRQRMIRILANPVRHDRAYQTFQRLFKQDSGLVLNRENEDRERVKELARKRFLLGYPPRKKDDTSFGDAYNWEWIIEVAVHHPANIIVVSRDSDYGISFDGKSYINDWLAQEFKDRVSKKRSVQLTDRLSNAFKALAETVTQEMEEVEEELIETKRRVDSTAVQEAMQIHEFLEKVTQTKETP